MRPPPSVSWRWLLPVGKGHRAVPPKAPGKLPHLGAEGPASPSLSSRGPKARGDRRECLWCNPHPLRCKAPPGPKRGRKENGLPRRFAPRNDSGCRDPVLLLIARPGPPGRGVPTGMGRRGRRSLQSEFHTQSVSQRTVERAQWSYFTTGPSERIVPRHCRANSIRRAETSDRSGGFTRLPSSKTYQSRVWLRALPGE